MSDREGWYARIGTGQIGPMSFDALKDLVKTGSLSRESLVWTDGMQDWQPASTIKGLFTEPPPVRLSPANPETLVPKTHTTSSEETSGRCTDPIQLFEIVINKDLLLRENAVQLKLEALGLGAGVLVFLLVNWLVGLAFIAIPLFCLWRDIAKQRNIPYLSYCIRDDVLCIQAPPNSRTIALDTIVGAEVSSFPMQRFWHTEAKENIDTVVVVPAAGDRVPLRAVLNPQEVSRLLLRRRR